MSTGKPNVVWALFELKHYLCNRIDLASESEGGPDSDASESDGGPDSDASESDGVPASEGDQETDASSDEDYVPPIQIR